MTKQSNRYFNASSTHVLGQAECLESINLYNTLKICKSTNPMKHEAGKFTQRINAGDNTEVSPIGYPTGSILLLAQKQNNEIRCETTDSK